LIFLPSNRTSPLSGSTNPPIILRVVVFPQPLGPRIVINSLSLKSRLMWFKITSPSNRTNISLKDIMVFFPDCSIHAPLFVKSLCAFYCIIKGRRVIVGNSLNQANTVRPHNSLLQYCKDKSIPINYSLFCSKSQLLYFCKYRFYAQIYCIIR
jgi:hypothetical protein